MGTIRRRSDVSVLCQILKEATTRTVGDYDVVRLEQFSRHVGSGNYNTGFMSAITTKSY